MILLLLPLLFSPFGLVASWLPTLYLLLWPVLIQTVSRDTLLTHGLVLIVFILTCDITRQTMHKLVGFDLISFPMGLLMLLAMVTERGTFMLSLLKPLFSGLITMSEPLFLALEIYLAVDLARRFNRWLSESANDRDDNSQDLSSWDPPLSSKAIISRLFIVVISIASYFGVYMIIQEAKFLLGPNYDTPINFTHAISALVTLQLVAFATTVYREEGILSESALICLIASVPIFIAAWSFNHLKESTNASLSAWSSYFPFSLFSQSVGEGRDLSELVSDSSHFGSDFFVARETSSSNDAPYIDFSILESSIERLEFTTGVSDTITKGILMVFLRRLIMIINSILALSLKNLANSYFGPDLCYILLGRVFALLWLLLVISLNNKNRTRSRRPNNESHGFVILSTDDHDDDQQPHDGGGFVLRLKSFAKILPMSKWTLIKVLLVLAYTQLLLQQMDNRIHLKEQISLVSGSQENTLDAPPACCSHSAGASSHQLAAQKHNQESDLEAWFDCMWTSAKACSGGAGGGQKELESGRQSRASRLLEFLWEFATQLITSLMALVWWFYQRFTRFDLLVQSVYGNWFARWRSPIIQRLVQSIFVHLYYISALLLVDE